MEGGEIGMKRYSEVTPPYSTKYRCGGQFNTSFLHIWKRTTFSTVYHITLNYRIVIFINPGFLCCIVKTLNLYCENSFYWIKLQIVHLKVLMSIWTWLFPVHVTACLTSLPINFKIMLKFNELQNYRFALYPKWIRLFKSITCEHKESHHSWSFVSMCTCFIWDYWLVGTTGLKICIVIGWLPIYRLVFGYINILSGVYLLAYVHMEVW